jgi:hypothetical protein
VQSLQAQLARLDAELHVLRERVRRLEDANTIKVVLVGNA